MKSRVLYIWHEVIPSNTFVKITFPLNDIELVTFSQALITSIIIPLKYLTHTQKGKYQIT